MPMEDHGPYLREIGDKFGEIFTLKFGRTYWVILNSGRVVNELLVKRAAIYSSRGSHMAHSIISGEKRMLLMPYGDMWRRQRRVMHQLLNSSQKTVFRAFQDLESKALMADLLEKPDRWYLSVARFSNSVIMSVVFGRRTALGDPEISALHRAQEEFVPFTMPGASVVDSFPFLAKIPYLKRLQPWRRKGDDINRRTTRTFTRLIEDLKRRIDQGVANSCFMTKLLESSAEKENFTTEELAYIAGTLIEAGTDTTRTSVLELVAGTAMYPEWIPRARAELDSVCGHNADRLPEFDDRDRLPMIKAAIKESVRWRPSTAQTGVPHALTTDDEFEGYHIPAGTTVTWNHWAISHSETEYKNAEQFYPDRFLDEDLDDIVKGHYGFGAGRRLCVGYNVAEGNLFISIARLIYCFDIEQELSHPVTVDKPFPVSAEVEPFGVIIKPRSEAHRRLIERECHSAAQVSS
ncbi:uncharacterized protein N7503_004437 [Penicillium pulvis]|uniref:uncharacterized protein n=1 Tax=Penicillium pulvis TaxID=1562058 RepID=UPI00254671ED|nr:uncharacterized protein N7503_004437 [Penicillium pulvis]KAJ5801987.1 hypothetical protein N7503_004437 [Penicillium pulvis]